MYTVRLRTNRPFCLQSRLILSSLPLLQVWVKVRTIKTRMRVWHTYSLLQLKVTTWKEFTLVAFNIIMTAMYANSSSGALNHRTITFYRQWVSEKQCKILTIGFMGFFSTFMSFLWPYKTQGMPSIYQYMLLSEK